MADTGAATAYTEVVLDGQGRIGHDVHCIQCGYNLRGLLVEQVCPECGTEVRMSLRPDFLHFAKPEWVETLARGMNWIVAGIVVLFLGSCIVPFIMLEILEARYDTVIWMMIALVWLLGTILLVGCWRLTAPDGRGLDLDRWSARMVARFCLITGSLLTVAISAGLLFSSMSAIIGWSSLLVSLLWLIGYFSTGRYLIVLAHRIPSPRLLFHTRICMWGTTLAMAISLLSYVLVILVVMTDTFGGRAMSGGVPAYFYMPIYRNSLSTSLCAGVIVLVFGLWSIVLIGRYRSAFAKAARQARATWAAETATLAETTISA